MMDRSEITGFVYTGRVAFHETDAAGIVHFSNYLRYAELAETHALDSCGLLRRLMQQGMILPRVQVQADYYAPLRFMDSYRVHAHLVQIGASSQRWQFDISADGAEVARLLWVTARRDAQGRRADYTPEERELLVPLLLPPPA